MMPNLHTQTTTHGGRTGTTLALLLAAVIITLLLAANPARAATTFTVNSTGDSLDSNPGDGFCLTGQAQACTLRAAIQEANAMPGADTIKFNIPDTGVKTIQVNSSGNGSLPPITDPVTIDGYSQPGASPNTAAKGINAKLKVVLSGAKVSPVTNGLDLLDSDITIRGLVINDFSNIGVVINGGNNRIEGNFIGTDASGTLDRGNSAGGVNINQPNNSLGGPLLAQRNLISGNDRAGVVTDTDDNRIEGNLIGTKKDGLGALGNGGEGVLVAGGADGVGIFSNSIFANGGIGIELSVDFGSGATAGPTPNDPGDLDLGPNGLQNFPVITSAESSATNTTMKGKLNSAPNSVYFVQFFSNPSGNEGQRLVGQTEVTSNSSGNATFSFQTKGKVGVGSRITATATDELTLSTSEFSAPRIVGKAIAPTVKSVAPPENATGIAPSANASALFSEAMDPATINATTVKLRKSGSTTSIAATVTYDAAAKRAILNPSANLAPGATYIATVTIGARDLAGNALDQDAGAAGNQAKTWKFTVRK